MIDSVLIDASFAFRLLLSGPLQSRARELVDGWLGEGYQLMAPSLWLYEITSALCKSVHFQGLSEDEGRLALNLAHSLGVHLVMPDEELSAHAYTWTLSLGRASAYDSFYLALAERLGCELWTADKRLANAAVRPWVHLLA